MKHTIEPSNEITALKSIISEALPELKARLRGLEMCWPNENISTEIRNLTRLIIKAENALSEP